MKMRLLKNSWGKIAGAIFLVCAGFSAYAFDPTQDQLTPLKAEVTTNFGPSSTFFWLLLVGELIVSVFTYIGTKNVKVFLSVLFIQLFITIGWSIIS